MWRSKEKLITSVGGRGMQEFFYYFPLVILFILKIRDLIAQNFNLSIPRKWKWLIYNKKSQNPVLCSRVYERDKTFGGNESNKIIIERLLIMDGKHIKKFDDGYFHRRKYASEIKSQYFINSLEASYNHEDLNSMTIAIRRLIQENGPQKIDFVLFLKNGNQTLAKNIFKNDRSIIYVCKTDEYSSYVPQGNILPMGSYSIQYENLDSLLSAANMNMSTNLVGVAIDCSISTGEGLKDIIQHFNNLLDENQNLKINKIEEAFILYTYKKIDDRTLEFKLHRFFDMDEDIRKMIYREIYQADNKGAGARKVYKKLKSKNYIHNDL